MLFRRPERRASLLGVVMALALVSATAEDGFDDVLTRIHITQTLHLKYKETRHLELITAPWQATGDLYISRQQMVIAQKTPNSATTIITATRLQHYNEARRIDRSINLEQPFAVPGMEPLMQLLFQSLNSDALQQTHSITMKNKARRWSLELKPRHRTQIEIDRIQLSGLDSEWPDRLVFFYEDGDRTNWEMLLISRGATADDELHRQLNR